MGKRHHTVATVLTVGMLLPGVAPAWADQSLSDPSTRIAPVVGADRADTTTDDSAERTDDTAQETATATETPEDTVRPVPAPVPEPVLGPVSEGESGSGEAVQERIADELADDWLGDPDRVAVTIRDVKTGEHLVDHNVDTLLTPASTTKLLTAAAIVTSLPMDEPFTTSVVAEPGSDTLTLVAGGDMLLATEQGNPDAVSGRAGLGDLVDQTVESLAAQDLGTEEAPVRLRLDTTFADGPNAPEGWTDFWLTEGFTGPITMLGLAEHRAFPYDPAPSDPAQAAARTFREALEERGVVVLGDPDDGVRREQAPTAAEPLAEVESAPARDVLTLALASSDNAMTEQLARIAAVASGGDPDPVAVRGWVRQQVEDYGVDLRGVELADVSGLSDGTTIPARVLGDLVVAGADGSHPGLQEVLGELPVAGYSGTLYDRYHLEQQRPAIGVARAKTGALPGVTSLAGHVVTRDGRLLAYAFIADSTETTGTAALEARSLLDTMVAELAACGC